MDSDDLDVRLSRQEALVLFDWLHRVAGDDRLVRLTEDKAELVALWNLSASLESLLVEPLRDDYQRLVGEARTHLRGSD